MPHPRPWLRPLFLTFLTALLAACQSMPDPSPFTREQIAALQSEGFIETDEGWELTLNERLLFPIDESRLQPGQGERIAKLAGHLLSVGITTARVEGHSDSTGTEAHNLKLSQARAEAVAEPMRASGMTFTPDQIVGRGEADPLSSNATAVGRQDNRRVVVIVTP